MQRSPRWQLPSTSSLAGSYHPRFGTCTHFSITNHARRWCGISYLWLAVSTTQLCGYWSMSPRYSSHPGNGSLSSARLQVDVLVAQEQPPAAAPAPARDAAPAAPAVPAAPADAPEVWAWQNDEEEWFNFPAEVSAALDAAPDGRYLYQIPNGGSYLLDSNTRRQRNTRTLAARPLQKGAPGANPAQPHTAAGSGGGSDRRLVALQHAIQMTGLAELPQLVRSLDMVDVGASDLWFRCCNTYSRQSDHQQAPSKRSVGSWRTRSRWRCPSPSLLLIRQRFLLLIL